MVTNSLKLLPALAMLTVSMQAAGEHALGQACVFQVTHLEITQAVQSDPRLGAPTVRLLGGHYTGIRAYVASANCPGTQTRAWLKLSAPVGGVMVPIWDVMRSENSIPVPASTATIDRNQNDNVTLNFTNGFGAGTVEFTVFAEPDVTPVVPPTLNDQRWSSPGTRIESHNFGVS